MAAKASTGDGQGVMVSNLPLLFANGKPTSLSAMSGMDLQYFIPFLVKCALGQEPRSWESLPKPYWWPDDVPYSQSSLNLGYSSNDSWTGKLRVLVNNCYTHHGCKYLLDFSAYLRDCDKKGVSYVKNNDGTTSMFEVNGQKLLVTFRDENREYDIAPRRAPFVNMTAVPSLPPQVATPHLLANLQRASAPYRNLAPNQSTSSTSQSSSRQQPPISQAGGMRFQNVTTTSTAGPGGILQQRLSLNIRPKPPVRPAVTPSQPSQQMRLAGVVRQAQPPAQQHAQNQGKTPLTPQQQLQLLLNRPDLAIRPVASSKPSQPASSQANTTQTSRPSAAAQTQSLIALQQRLLANRPKSAAPARLPAPLPSQHQSVTLQSQPQSASISQEVAAALQKKLSASAKQKQKLMHVPQNVAHILKSLQENMGGSVTIQMPGRGITLNPPGAAATSPTAPMSASLNSRVNAPANTQASPSTSASLAQKKATPKTSPVKTPHRPTLLPKLSRTGSQKDDIVDIYLCDFCDQQFTSLQQTKVHEATCKARNDSSAKSQARKASPRVPKPLEPDVIEIKGDNQEDFMKCFGLMQKSKAPKVEECRRRFVPKMIDDVPRKLFLSHQGRYMNIPLSCSMGRTFVTLSSKLLNAAALRPQIERYDRMCSTNLDEVGHTIRVSVRDTSLLAMRLQSGVRRGRDYQHDYCFSTRERRLRYKYLKTGLSKRSRALKRSCKIPVLKIHKLTEEEMKDWKRYTVKDFGVVHPDLTSKVSKACPLPKKLEMIRDVTPKYTKMTPRVPPIRIRAMPNGAMSIATGEKPSKPSSGNNTPVKAGDMNGQVGKVPDSQVPLIASLKNGTTPQKARKSFLTATKFANVEELREFMAAKSAENPLRGVKRKAKFFAGRRRKRRQNGTKRPTTKTGVKPHKDVNSNPSVLYHTDSDGSLHADPKKLTREQRSLLKDECKELRSRGLSNLLLTEKGHVTRRSLQISDSPVPSDSPIGKHLKVSPVPPASPILGPRKESGEMQMEKSLFYGSSFEPVVHVTSENGSMKVSVEMVMFGETASDDTKKGLSGVSNSDTDMCKAKLELSSETVEKIKEEPSDAVNSKADQNEAKLSLECVLETKDEAIQGMDKCEVSFQPSTDKVVETKKEGSLPVNSCTDESHANIDRSLKAQNGETSDDVHSLANETDAKTEPGSEDSVKTEKEPCDAVRSGIEKSESKLESSSDNVTDSAGEVEPSVASVEPSDEKSVRPIQVSVIVAPPVVSLVNIKLVESLPVEAVSLARIEEKHETDSRNSVICIAEKRKSSVPSSKLSPESVFTPAQPVDSTQTIVSAQACADTETNEGEVFTKSDTEHEARADEETFVVAKGNCSLPLLELADDAAVVETKSPAISVETTAPLTIIEPDTEHESSADENASVVTELKCSLPLQELVDDTTVMETIPPATLSETAAPANIIEPSAEATAEEDHAVSSDDDELQLSVSPLPSTQGDEAVESASLGNSDSEMTQADEVVSKNIVAPTAAPLNAVPRESNLKPTLPLVPAEKRKDVSCSPEVVISPPSPKRLRKQTRTNSYLIPSEDSKSSIAKSSLQPPLEKLPPSRKTDLEPPSITVSPPRLESHLSPNSSRPAPRVSPRERKTYSPAEYVVSKIGKRSWSPATKANRELKRLQRDECKELKQKGLENLQVKNGRLTRARLKVPNDEK